MWEKCCFFGNHFDDGVVGFPPTPPSPCRVTRLMHTTEPSRLASAMPSGNRGSIEEAEENVGRVKRRKKNRVGQAKSHFRRKNSAPKPGSEFGPRLPEEVAPRSVKCPSITGPQGRPGPGPTMRNP